MYIRCGKNRDKNPYIMGFKFAPKMLSLCFEKGELILLYWLLEKGFTEEQIKQYAESKNYTLEELSKDINIQIDSMIKHQIFFDLYKEKR